MRILQIIDSLEIGGAEKMAINYANALSNRVDFSGLVATRKEGSLKNQIGTKVNYLFLNRTQKIDLKAILRLRKYCKENSINYLQPHSSSFFTALLVKFTLPKIKIIWHDHNGLSEFLSSRRTLALKFASLFFNGIVVVNYQLKNWAEQKLLCKKVIYLPNFTSLNSNEITETQLLGENRKRILCLANLRFQKNHFLLLDVAEKLIASHPDWSFHLVGKDFEDDYSKEVRSKILEKQLKNVFVYGSKKDISNIINQSEIAILTSQSEGLPVSIIEYGLHKKPIVATAVGEIPLIINNGDNGFVVSNYDSDKFYLSLVKLIENKDLRVQMGNSIYTTIDNSFSEKGVLTQYINWIE